MPSITICPRCTSHLGIPADASAADQVQCPICEVEFSLATVRPRELQQARIVAHAVESTVEASAESAEQLTEQLSPQERLSQLLRSTSQWSSPPVEPDPASDAVDSHEDDAYPDAELELDPPQTPREQPQLGSSRLDQLLSDLTKGSAAPTPVAEEALLSNDFEAELDDERHAGEDHEIEEEALVPTVGETSEGEEPSFEPRTAPRRRRRASGVGTLIGVVGGGAIGILLGAYGLLWLKGPAGDFLGLANWLPRSVLPSSVVQIANDDSASSNVVAPVETPSQESELLIVQSEPAKFDPAVAPATAEEPIVPETPAPTLAESASPAPQAWPATPIVGDLRGVKLFSVAELDKLLAPADAALRKFLAGDLTQQQSWSTMGPAYMQLAALAERYTLVDPAEYGNDLITMQLAAKNIFRGVAGDPARRSDLATVAARWLQHDRRQNQGVILVGKVRDLHPQGKWTEYVIDVPLGDGVVTVNILLDKVQFAMGDEIAVAGVILARPQEELLGYKADAAPLIVAGYAFPPEEFVAPAAAAADLLPFESSAGGQ